MLLATVNGSRRKRARPLVALGRAGVIGDRHPAVGNPATQGFGLSAAVLQTSSKLLDLMGQTKLREECPNLCRQAECTFDNVKNTQSAWIRGAARDSARQNAAFTSWLMNCTSNRLKQTDLFRNSRSFAQPEEGATGEMHGQPTV